MCLNHTGKGGEREKGFAMVVKQMGHGVYLLPLPDQWNALLMLALSYHISGMISCCVLRNRGSMNTIWHSINHMCQSGKTQQILLCQQPSSLRVGGDKAFHYHTSWRPPVSRHRPDQFCIPELMFQFGNLKGEPQDCIYCLRLLHCSGHDSVLIEVHNITPLSFSLLP